MCYKVSGFKLHITNARLSLRSQVFYESRYMQIVGRELKSWEVLFLFYIILFLVKTARGHVHSSSQRKFSALSPKCVCIKALMVGVNF